MMLQTNYTFKIPGTVHAEPSIWQGTGEGRGHPQAKRKHLEVNAAAGRGRMREEAWQCCCSRRVTTAF